MKYINIEKTNKWLAICLSVVVLIIMPVIPEIRGIGIYSLKTSIFTISTLIIALAYLCLNAIYRYNDNVKITKYEWLLIAYIGFIGISSAVSKYDWKDLLLGTNGRGEGILTVFCYIVTFIIFERNFKYSEKVFNIMTIAIVIASGWGIVQSIIPEYINLRFINKEIIMSKMAVSNMINPNFFSSWLLIFLPIYISRFLIKKEKELIPIIGIIFMAFVCARTMSGYITFAVTLIGILIICGIKIESKKEYIKTVGILILTLIISFSVVVAINGKSYLYEIGSFKSELRGLKNKENSFGSNRGIAWKIGMKVAKDYPLFGVGIDSFANITVANERYFWSEYSNGGYYFDKVHCEYLQIAATTGVPSLMCYIAFLILLAVSLLKLFSYNIKNNKNNTICIALGVSIFAYLMQAGANISITCVAPAFWIMLGAAANICNKNIDK